MTGYRIPRRVAHVVSDADHDLPEAVFLMHLPDGTPQVLHGSAAWIWLMAVDGEEDVAAAVAHLVGKVRQEVADDVESFLAEVVRQGFLEERGSPS
mgnify:CR=1 FL=1